MKDKNSKLDDIMTQETSEAVDK